MEEVEFPEKCTSYECGSYYDFYDIEEWFEKCLKDFPGTTYYDAKDVVKYYNGYAMAKWFDKWFSQFKIKGEKNE